MSFTDIIENQCLRCTQEFWSRGGVTIVLPSTKVGHCRKKSSLIKVPQVQGPQRTKWDVWRCDSSLSIFTLVHWVHTHTHDLWEKRRFFFIYLNSPLDFVPAWVPLQPDWGWSDRREDIFTGVPTDSALYSCLTEWEYEAEKRTSLRRRKKIPLSDSNRPTGHKWAAFQFRGVFFPP